MKSINELLNVDYDIKIAGITSDSRLVLKNYLFVATKGLYVDHFNYINDAIKNGCSFIVCDREIDFDFPHLVVQNINQTYRDLCKKFYDINDDDFSLIGITGTDGKTTTACIVNKLLDDIAYIGTNGVIVNNKNYKTNNTTPDSEELFKDFSIIKSEGVNKIIMEVSSEALLHQRVDNLKYKIVAFTNITGDHFNVHKSFDDYVSCKMHLLDLLERNSHVVVNGDDNILRKINNTNLISFGFLDDNDFVIKDVKYYDCSTSFSVKHNDLTFIINSPLIGKHNVYNVTLAFVICYLCGVDSNIIIERIKNLLPIDGRCEFLDFGQSYKIVLDYAHTINGISNILDSFAGKDIITVTGCAGGRDTSKRHIIGDMVIKKSRLAIFTMDDPRNEDVNKIIDQMVLDNKNYVRIIDRTKAIEYALNQARPNSVVLILGKGRDEYMAIGNKKVYYNDYDVIKDFFD